MSTRQERLRKAEKLLRQGRLDAAIVEYVAAVEEQPRDWATTNALGDLYVRANQVDQAATQYGRIAEHFWKEGFFPKAAALYKKILKVKPTDEGSQLRLADISARQGLLVDAKTHYAAIIEQRRKRGDLRGANELVVRLGELDPADIDARQSAGRALVSLGETTKAIEVWSGLATDLAERGRAEEAVLALRQVVDLEPRDMAARGRLARAYLASGDLAAAREHLTAEVAGDDPTLLLAVAELELRAGRLEAGREIVDRILAREIGLRDQVATLAWHLCDGEETAAFVCVDALADQAIAQADWDSAAAVLQEFATRAPHHVDALLKLVEICVDGALEETMVGAQAQLADAYLATGRAAEARVIAEDLVAREPWDQAHLQRYRDALVQLGEPDPDARIAERLNGGTPFSTTGGLAPRGVGEVDEVAELLRAAPPAPAPAPPEPVLAAALDRGRSMPSEPPKAETPTADSLLDSFDFSSLLDVPPPKREEPPPPRKAKKAPAGAASHEIDLTSVLGELTPARAGKAPAPPPSGSSDSAPSLDAVFQQFREEATTQQPADDVAAQQFQLGISYGKMGQLDDAIAALEKAARSLRHRFRAAALLGRIYRQKGVGPRALDWFERAAEAPAPTEEERRALLYDLGETLEKLGETARALAVFLELQADAGSYRDVDQKVDRLARV